MNLYSLFQDVVRGSSWKLTQATLQLEVNVTKGHRWYSAPSCCLFFNIAEGTSKKLVYSFQRSVCLINGRAALVCLLAGTQFILQSDRNPLKHLRKQKDPRGKFGRWLAELEEFEYTVEYIPGKCNVKGSALSRNLNADEKQPLSQFEEKIFSIEDKYVYESMFTALLTSVRFTDQIKQEIKRQYYFWSKGYRYRQWSNSAWMTKKWNMSAYKNRPFPAQSSARAYICFVPMYLCSLSL